MITRRTALIGGASLVASPAIVSALSLDFVPQHRYYAYQFQTGIHDIVRDDGKVIGWLSRFDRRMLPDRKKSTILAHAAEGIDTNNRLLFGKLAEGNPEAKPITLSEFARLS